jgi:hypothetical protein
MMEEKNEFQQFHDSMRRYKRRVFVDPKKNSRKPYVRPKRDGEVTGKLNLKRAKRERVKAMKAAQANGNAT